jgi:CheY-like chemotaxis protein
MLRDAGVRYAHIEQRWDSRDPIEAILEFGRVDVLLLDYYLPPMTGYKVLERVNAAVREGLIERPKHIIGMSSVMSCNRELIGLGADAGFVKWDVGLWDGWSRVADDENRGWPAASG